MSSAVYTNCRDADSFQRKKKKAKSN